jgi:vacuolar-type H+-ATPase subunit E/Vma4
LKKAKKILDDLLAAKAQREAAEENARIQEEIRAAQAEATKELLRGFFEKKAL